MFNIYVVHDMSVFNVPSTTLSLMHIAPRQVALTQYILLLYVTELFWLN